MELAELVRQRAASDAWIVDFTNPVGIVTQALLDEGHRALGLCNVAIGFQRQFAQDLGVPPERVVLDHVGLNHLSWITAVTVDGTDRLPEILESKAPDIASMVRLPTDTIRELGAVPSYHLRYYYAFDEVLAEQRAGHKRAEEVIDLERQLLEMYSDPALDTKPALLNHRGGAFYSEAAAAAGQPARRRRRHPGRRSAQRDGHRWAGCHRRGRGLVAHQPGGRHAPAPARAAAGDAGTPAGGEGL